MRRGVTAAIKLNLEGSGPQLPPLSEKSAGKDPLDRQTVGAGLPGTVIVLLEGMPSPNARTLPLRTGAVKSGNLAVTVLPPASFKVMLSVT